MRAVTSRLTEPDRRYWRARGNRRVRKARLARSIRRWLVVGGLQLAVLGSAAYAVVRGVEVAARRPGLAIDRVVIDGAEWVTDESLRERVAGYLGTGILEIDLDAVAARLEEEPWVRGASVKRVLPGVLRIRIVEHRPAALADLDGTVHVIDDRGEVIAPVDPGSRFDLPLVVGADRFDGPARTAALRRGVDRLGRLRAAQPEWSRGIARLDVSAGDRIAVTLAESGPKLLLDPTEVERNLEHYLALDEAITSRVGRVAYVDLRWRDRINVMPEIDS